MIFLTLGTHEPFDRLVKAVDDWCAERGRGGDVFGQITDRAGYRPAHFKWVARIDPAEYRRRCTEAPFIIAHAGMGSIITALTFGKPIAILPRRSHLGEMRNDHQYATAQHFRERPGIYAAMTETELPGLLDELAAGAGAPAGNAASAYADDELIGTLRDFIRGPARRH